MADELTAAEKLSVACELFDAGVDLMRQNLRRRHPEASPEEIRGRLQGWLYEFGDGAEPQAAAFGLAVREGGLAETLGRALGDLERAGARCALVDGLAVSVRTEPQFTRGIALAVTVEGDARAEGIIDQVGAQFGWSVLARVEQNPPTVRLEDPAPDEPMQVVVDLRFGSSGIEREIVEEAERVEFLGGALAPVASSHHLLALRVLSMDDDARLQDRVDAKALLRVLDEEGRERARAALHLIEERGFHRGKDLLAEFDGLLPR